MSRPDDAHVCMYICVRAYVYTYAFTCVCASYQCPYVCALSVNTCVCVNVCIWVCLCVHINIFHVWFYFLCIDFTQTMKYSRHIKCKMPILFLIAIIYFLTHTAHTIVSILISKQDLGILDSWEFYVFYECLPEFLLTVVNNVWNKLAWKYGLMVKRNIFFDIYYNSDSIYNKHWCKEYWYIFLMNLSEIWI